MDAALDMPSAPPEVQTKNQSHRENEISSNDDYLYKLFFHIKLLTWKRILELSATPMETVKTIMAALLFFALLILLDEDLLSSLPKGLLEFFIVPLAFWAYSQTVVIQAVTEKHNRLQESMKMSGLTESAYW